MNHYYFYMLDPDWGPAFIKTNAPMHPGRSGSTLNAMSGPSASWLSSAMPLVVSQPGIAIPDREERDRVARTKRGALLALPPDRHPLTIAAADVFTDCEDPAGYLALGVELLIGGVRATAPAAVGMTVVDDDRAREEDR